jgi:ribosome-associated protein
MTQRKPTKSATPKPAAKKSSKTAKPKTARAAKPSAAASEPDDDDDGDDGGLAVALEALELALDKKAVEPVLLDVRELCGYCNYQLVLSGRSERQVDAISEGVVAGLRDRGLRPLGTEGKRSGHWSLLDFGDVVVHVFNHQVREHYDLEGLWNDAPRVPIEVPADARLPADTY